jgi:zinc D-Ala-D-Ala carboxypeptidase
MELTRNFTLQELIKSDTAIRKGINNNPNAEQIEKLKVLCEKILQPVRDHFGRVKVTSADFVLLSFAKPSVVQSTASTRERRRQILNVLELIMQSLQIGYIESLDWDQLIVEYYVPGEPNSGWIHCSVTEGTPRKQFLHAYREENKTKYKPILGKAKDLLV